MPRLVDPVVPAGRLSSMEQPLLHAGDDLLLRPWQGSDAQDLMAAFSDRSIQQWHVRTIESQAEACEWIASWHDRWKSESDAGWAMARPTGELCDYVGLRGVSLEAGVAQVSYWVVPGARGRALAARGTLEVSTWAFEELGLTRLWLMHSVRNDPSCRVALKAGFAVEGTLRGGLLHADGQHDMHVHGRLADDSESR